MESEDEDVVDGQFSVPVEAVYNNDFGGAVPECLVNMTVPEMLLISPIICKIYIIKLVTYGAPSSAQRAIKGNCVAFMQDISKVCTELPSIPALTKYLKVCFVGNHECPERLQQVKKILTVRRQKVHDALLWLTQHNVAFQRMGITIDVDGLNALPEDDVHEDIVATLVRSAEVEQALGEASSYVPYDNAEL